jgi:hypothetical protein
LQNGRNIVASVEFAVIWQDSDKVEISKTPNSDDPFS